MKLLSLPEDTSCTLYLYWPVLELWLFSPGDIPNLCTVTRIQLCMSAKPQKYPTLAAVSSKPHAFPVSTAALVHQTSTRGLVQLNIPGSQSQTAPSPSISSELQSCVTPCPPQKPTQVYSKKEKDKITNKDLSPFSAHSLLETVFLSNFTWLIGIYHLFQKALRWAKNILCLIGEEEIFEPHTGRARVWRTFQFNIVNSSVSP